MQEKLGWNVDDSHRVDINEEKGPAEGALKNPLFPDKVRIDEPWSGGIDGVNVGDSTGTFRFEVDGQVTDSFRLDPGQSARLTVDGRGPAEFTITIQRYADGNWVEDDSYYVDINPEEKPTYTVKCHVENYYSGNPIEGATVYMDGAKQGTTDSSGNLSIGNVSEGSHKFRVEAEYYNPAEATINVTSDITVTFRLIPLYGGES